MYTVINQIMSHALLPTFRMNFVCVSLLMAGRNPSQCSVHRFGHAVYDVVSYSIFLIINRRGLHNDFKIFAFKAFRVLLEELRVRRNLARRSAPAPLRD